MTAPSFRVLCETLNTRVKKKLEREKERREKTIKREFFPFFSRGVQNMICATNWVADGAPDAKLPGFWNFDPNPMGPVQDQFWTPKLQK